MDNYQYEPIVISGPSGAGKTMIITTLRNKYKGEISEAVGYTTRKPRLGEKDGEEYYFTTKDYFRKMIDNNEFIEYIEYVNEFYGMPISEIVKAKKEMKIFNVGLTSAIEIKKKCPNAITIYILPPDAKELLRRIGNRGRERYEKAKEEVKQVSEFYEYLVISRTNNIEESVKEIEEIIFNNSRKNLMENNKDFILHYYDEENPL